MTRLNAHYQLQHYHCAHVSRVEPIAGHVVTSRLW